MSKGTVLQAIAAHNAGRDPERLAMKMRAMQASAFSFFRGTCHLFYADVPDVPILRDVPSGWLCGDLHLENFGTFKADNRLTYFDMNDFDEAVLGPATWDLWRFLASTMVGAESIGLTPKDAARLGAVAADSFRAAMREGKARWTERATATGLVRDLLANLKQRSRPAFLAVRTRVENRRRMLRVDGKRALPATEAQRKAVTRVIETLGASQPHPRFFRVMDVARRIAGTGSLGLDRYAILIEGRGSPNGNFLLDLKRATPSSLARAVGMPQPQFAGEADRVICVQNWMQAVSPALLAACRIDGDSYLLKELQPAADRVDLTRGAARPRRLDPVLTTMGSVAAWAMLRAAGRHGASGPDELIAYFASATWKKPLLEQARASAALARRQWLEFRRDYEPRTAR